MDGVGLDVTAENISRALKLAAAKLQYPTTKGILIDRINTHSLRLWGRKCACFGRILRHTNPKKRDGGEVPLSKNIFARNWHVMPQACQKT
jgi:hypothetical protein